MSNEVKIIDINDIKEFEKSSGLDMPDQKKNDYRPDPYIAENGVSLMSAITMFYGAPKKGKTRLTVDAFSGSKYIFLDFDRNYEVTSRKIEDSGAYYYNGRNAISILDQLIKGKAKNTIVVIDALNSIIPLLCNAYNKNNEGSEINTAMVGVDDATTKKFFNELIFPMSEGGNSINIIHHTTENLSGSKMSGNKASWTSLFDFTYRLEGSEVDPQFVLEAGRLPLAPKTIGLKVSLPKAIEFLLSREYNYGDEIPKTEFTRLTKNDRDKWVRDFEDELFDKKEVGTGRSKKIVFVFKQVSLEDITGIKDLESQSQQ